jgi:hypothetical protein
MEHKVIEVLTGGAGALVLSAAARALPVPRAGGNAFYLWFYQFTHLLLANFDKVGINMDGSGR